MYAIPTNAKNPVLAHLFLNFMMDEFNAMKNWSWIGLPGAVQRGRSDTIFEESYPGLEGWFVWDYEAPAGPALGQPQADDRARRRTSTIGKRAIGLPVDVDSLWQNAYSEFKAGA